MLQGPRLETSVQSARTNELVLPDDMDMLRNN